MGDLHIPTRSLTSIPGAPLSPLSLALQRHRLSIDLSAYARKHYICYHPAVDALEHVEDDER